MHAVEESHQQEGPEPAGAEPRRARGEEHARGDERERWLFVSPHDDDAVLGAGLLLQAAVRDGVEVHLAVVTDGRMGYCTDDQRDRIVEIRKKESQAAYGLIGIENIHWLDYPDCDLRRYAGRRRVDSLPGGRAPDVRAGFNGLQNSFTALLRDLRPRAVFAATGADYHPDHKVVSEELEISLFHAGGAVWPELGAPVQNTPQLFEYAVYCDYPAEPTVQAVGEQADFDAKLRAVGAYRSQKQIAELIAALERSGPYEYFREVAFSLYDSRRYRLLFEQWGSS
jgi:LmbE family N-acetylglucosaminyl deacetylase